MSPVDRNYSDYSIALTANGWYTHQISKSLNVYDSCLSSNAAFELADEIDLFFNFGGFTKRQDSLKKS
jgi:hypothetical protein